MNTHSAPLLSFVVLCALAAAGVPAQEAAAPPAPEAQAPAPARIGAVESVKGEAWAVDAGERRRALTEGSAVFLDERVETDAGARLKIVFEDGSTLSLGENSVIVVDSMVYDPGCPKSNGFVMRVVNGMCRILTGKITEMNPEGFKVRTKMATIGIRGCELGFRSTSEKEDIYIIQVPPDQTIRIETTTTGTAILNVLTGEEIPIDESIRKVIEIRDPGTRLSVTRGAGPEQGAFGPRDLRNILNLTSQFAPAEYELIQSREGSMLRLRPQQGP